MLYLCELINLYMSKFSTQKEESIISDYLKGLNTIEIAKKWNTYNTSIRRVLIRNNIVLRSASEAHRKALYNPFKIGDEKSEYFLGLLLTDGCLAKHGNNLQLSLYLKDKEMVELFRDFVCPTNKVRSYYYKESDSTIYSTCVTHPDITNWLCDNGNFQNKSLKCDIFTPLTWNILRGIFDGDGYWHVTNKGKTITFGICGCSKIFIYKIQQFLYENGFSPIIRKDSRNREHTLYYVECHKIAEVSEIAYKIYNKSTIYLKRKFETWHSFEETHKNKILKFRERAGFSNPEPNL